jgi:hypothetical protein
VEERPDATNVNNWHWTEKNADAWSKSKIKVSEDFIFALSAVFHFFLVPIYTQNLIEVKFSAELSFVFSDL